MALGERSPVSLRCAEVALDAGYGDAKHAHNFGTWVALIYRSQDVLSHIFGIGFHPPLLSHGSSFCHAAVVKEQFLRGPSYS